jgi:hypothetical protein
MKQDMLDSCIIQPRRSLFSALVVMVRIKDNSWRMCPDYKDLNKSSSRINSIFQIFMRY